MHVCICACLFVCFLYIYEYELSINQSITLSLSLSRFYTFGIHSLTGSFSQSLLLGLRILGFLPPIDAKFSIFALAVLPVVCTDGPCPVFALPRPVAAFSAPLGELKFYICSLLNLVACSKSFSMP